MKFNTILIALATIPAFTFSAEEANINIYIVTPKLQTLDIGSGFSANHQSYPLLPSVIRHNYIEYPIFSAREALCIQDTGTQLYKTVKRGAFIALPVTITTDPVNTDITVSISEEDKKQFSFLAQKYPDPNVPIKLYFIDVSSSEISTSLIEILPNKRYSIDEVKGKTIFVFLPKDPSSSIESINMSYYSLPLEVHYHSP